tara:strand:- start:1244 stop:1522 length:279 start_codon:yes stop_codon:yes gene_type:complete
MTITEQAIQNNCYILEQYEQECIVTNKKYLVRALASDNKETGGRTIYGYLGKNAAKKLGETIPTKRLDKIAVALNYHPTDNIPPDDNIITFH